MWYHREISQEDSSRWLGGFNIPLLYIYLISLKHTHTQTGAKGFVLFPACQHHHPLCCQSSSYLVFFTSNTCTYAELYRHTLTHKMHTRRQTHTNTHKKGSLKLWRQICSWAFLTRWSTFIGLESLRSIQVKTADTQIWSRGRSQWWLPYMLNDLWSSEQECHFFRILATMTVCTV